MSTRTTTLLFVAACLTLLLAAPPRLQAATLVLSSTADSGPGSMREALADASSGDTIDATGLAGTITLTSGSLPISNDVTILGPGFATLTISGNSTSCVLEITATNAMIGGLTIANGSTTESGAGIRIGGDPDSTVLIQSCVIRDNSATLDGGGIYNGSGVTLQIHGCIISGNTASRSGGAIYNDNAHLTISNSTISSNTASVGGGGILNAGGSTLAILQIDRSTVNGNRAEYGGAIYNAGGSSASASLLNSTLSDNSAHNTAGAVYNDAAWNDDLAQLEIYACTLRGNTAGPGAAIYNDGRFGGNAEISIANTILEAGDSKANLRNDSGQVTSLGHNLSNDDGSGLLTHESDLIDTDPLLGPLQDNGGPTFTHALLAGSPAIDAGNSGALETAIGPDQRGLPRPIDDPVIDNASGGDGTDIGAFELSPAMTISRQKARLRFSRPNADKLQLKATLDLGEAFDPAGQSFNLDFAGATLALTLDARGRGATARGVTPAGRIKVAWNRKTGLWTLRAKLKRGTWRDPWSLRGLLNDHVPRPGQPVTMPVIVRIGNQGFVGEGTMVYTARVDKAGTAR